jgi:hypothetical protein
VIRTPVTQTDRTGASRERILDMYVYYASIAAPVL